MKDLICSVRTISKVFFNKYSPLTLSNSHYFNTLIRAFLFNIQENTGMCLDVVIPCLDLPGMLLRAGLEKIWEPATVINDTVY